MPPKAYPKAYINAVRYPVVYVVIADNVGTKTIKENTTRDKAAGVMPLWGHKLCLGDLPHDQPSQDEKE